MTTSKSLIKLWTIPTENLIIQNKEQNDIDINDISSLVETKLEIPQIPDFNFYILRGDLFKNYMSVFSITTPVDLTFNLVEIENKLNNEINLNDYHIKFVTVLNGEIE